MIRRAIGVAAIIAVAGAIFSLGWYGGSRSTERRLSEVPVPSSPSPEPAVAVASLAAPSVAPGESDQTPSAIVERVRAKLGELERLEARLEERCPAEEDGTVNYDCYPTVRPTYQEIMHILEDARVDSKRCLQSDKSAFDCHLALGATYAKLARWTGDAERYPKLGADHYVQFLKLAPRDHPKRHRVDRMMQDYER
jgi:hypothetical protein